MHLLQFRQINKIQIKKNLEKKIGNVENKISDVSGLEVGEVENKILDVSELVKKIDYDAKIRH